MLFEFAETINLNDNILCTQSAWSRSMRIKGCVDDIIKMIKGDIPKQYMPYQEFDEMKELLEKYQREAKFVIRCKFEGEDIEINFELKLSYDGDIPTINITNLELYQVINNRLVQRAFVIMNTASHKITDKVSGGIYVDRGPIIYPFYGSKYINGEMTVHDNYDLNAMTKYIDMFKLALFVSNI